MKHHLKLTDCEGRVFYLNPSKLTCIELNLDLGPGYDGCCLVSDGPWSKALDKESTAILIKYLEEPSYKECE